MGNLSRLAHPNCQQNAYEDVELVKVNESGMVHVQHVKHSVDLGLVEVSALLHEANKLHVCDII